MRSFVAPLGDEAMVRRLDLVPVIIEFFMGMLAKQTGANIARVLG